MTAQQQPPYWTDPASGLVDLWHGDVLDCLRMLPDNSVHCCITSPPYMGLRDYQTGTWEGGDAECNHAPVSSIQGQTGQRADRTFTGAKPQRGRCSHCGAVRIDQQIGLEATVEEYIAKLVAVFREVRRVLRSDGTLWLNIGDSYNGSGGAGGDYAEGGLKEGQPKYPGRKVSGLKPKDLLLIPERLAIALQEDGWYVRSRIAWAKRSPMPESVQGSQFIRHRITQEQGEEAEGLRAQARGDSTGPTRDGRGLAGNSAAAQEQLLLLPEEEGSHDRPRNSSQQGRSALLVDCPGCRKCEAHDGYILRISAGRPTSAWEHIWLLTKSGRYYFDAEAVREPQSTGTHSQGKNGVRAGAGLKAADDRQLGIKNNHTYTDQWADLPEGTGRNLRNFWLLGPSAFPEAHFATFVPEIPRRAILAGTSERGCCPACGAGWVRVVEKGTPVLNPDVWSAKGAGQYDNRIGGMRRTSLEEGSTLKHIVPRETTGWRQGCTCPPAPAVPCVVLDPFAGSGTAVMVAKQLMRRGIGIDLSAAYFELAKARVRSVTAGVQLELDTDAATDPDADDDD